MTNLPVFPSRMSTPQCLPGEPVWDARELGHAAEVPPRHTAAGSCGPNRLVMMIISTYMYWQSYVWQLFLAMDVACVDRR